MSYVIRNSRQDILAVVADGTTNTSATPLTLVGRGVTDYGLAENENYVYILENFANSTAPLAPILGQLWYNSSTDTLSVYDTANTWNSLATVSYVDSKFVSPFFSGTATANTAPFGTNSTQLATTAFVQAALNGGGTGNTAVTGNLSVTGTITTGTNVLANGYVSAVGNIIGSNINGVNLSLSGNVISALNVTNTVTSNNVVAVGNVTANNLNAAGLSLTANVISALNISTTVTAGIVSAVANVVGGNITTSGIVSASGNITSAANVISGNVTTVGMVSALGNVYGNNVITGTVTADTIYATNFVTSGLPTTAFRLPNLTQTQITALTAQNGDMVYNSDYNLPQIYQNGQWWNFTISYYS